MFEICKIWVFLSTEICLSRKFMFIKCLAKKCIYKFLFFRKEYHVNRSEY